MIGDILVNILIGLILFGPVRWTLLRLPVVQRMFPHRFTTIRPFRLNEDVAAGEAPRQTRASKASWVSTMGVRARQWSNKLWRGPNREQRATRLRTKTQHEPKA